MPQPLPEHSPSQLSLLHHPGVGADGAGDGDPGAFVLHTAVVLVWLALAAGYVLAGRVAVLRGRTVWPGVRTGSWLAGTVLGLLVSVGPVATAAGRSFTAHTAVHLMLGMLVPLLLVLGAPVTLLLRAVPVGVGQRISKVARSNLLRVVSHPVVALALTAVPLVLIYGDGTALPLLHHPAIGPALHTHFVASGALFASAVVGLDPDPHRASVAVRAAVLVASIAVHGVIAKHLYSLAGSAGLPPDTEQAAQLMYYGGDAIHVLLLAVFCLQVYRRTGRSLHRAAAPTSGDGSPGHVV